MKRFGLIGHPVAGSFSPRLFEAAYGGRYAYDLLEGADFGASWQRFLDHYDGINITAPFKQDAFRSVDVLSDDARRCGAVNLAVKTSAGIVGYNTDVDGVILAVREACGLPVREEPANSTARVPLADALVDSCGCRQEPMANALAVGCDGGQVPLTDALVVGCGGAGRAAAVAAQRLGCRVTLVNRTPARAAALASELGCTWIPLSAFSSSCAPASTETPTPSGTTSLETALLNPPPAGGLSPDLVIYTVPGPMEGLPAFPNAVILEANYRTPCLEGQGRVYISGMRWLLYQAVAGYSIFTGETPDADAMFRIFC